MLLILDCIPELLPEINDKCKEILLNKDFIGLQTRTCIAKEFAKSNKGNP